MRSPARSLRMFGTAAGLVVFAGCAHELRPMSVPEVPIDLERQVFLPGSRVHLVNARAEAEPYIVYDDGFHEFAVSPAEWSEGFLKALERELGRRGVKNDPSGVPCELGVGLEPKEEESIGPPLFQISMRIGGLVKVYPVAELPGELEPEVEHLKQRLSSSLKATLFVAMLEILSDPEFQRAIAGQR